MKRLFAALAILAVAGFGCTNAGSDVPAAVDPSWTVYENGQYGFSFAYPSNMEVRQREEDVRPTQYLGVDADFFISLRDTVRDAKPTNVAWFYGASGLTVKAFEAALVASNANGAVQVKSSEKVTVNGLELTKVVSTTELGTDKVHYLVDRDGTLVIVSVFLAEETAWEPVLRTMRGL